MWFQLKIEHCRTENIEQLSEDLEECGALSIMLTDKHDNPVLEPEPGTTPLWPEVIIQALFAQNQELQQAKEHLELSHPHLTLNIEVLADKDWERVWMDDFKPRRFGARLWICPTWATPPEPDAVNIMLDPGLAFGTGTHPTTSLCLSWLEQADLNKKMVIDYGCGSGILSIAALKLGASHVFAVDIDDQALTATINNCESNQLDPQKLSISKPEVLHTKVDLLIANILLDPLISLKDRFFELLHPLSKLIVSGILSEQVPLLVSAYEDVFSLSEEQAMNGWSLLVFTRN